MNTSVARLVFFDDQARQFTRQPPSPPRRRGGKACTAENRFVGRDHLAIGGFFGDVKLDPDTESWVKKESYCFGEPRRSKGSGMAINQHRAANTKDRLFQTGNNNNGSSVAASSFCGDSVSNSNSSYYNNGGGLSLNMDKGIALGTGDERRSRKKAVDSNVSSSHLRYSQEGITISTPSSSITNAQRGRAPKGDQWDLHDGRRVASLLHTQQQQNNNNNNNNNNFSSFSSTPQQQQRRPATAAAGEIERWSSRRSVSTMESTGAMRETDRSENVLRPSTLSPSREFQVPKRGAGLCRPRDNNWILGGGGQ